MKKADQKKLQTSIYFLKVNELKDLLEYLNLDSRGKKGELINRIFNHYKISQDTLSVLQNFKPPKKHPENVNEQTHIIPGKYTNGKKSRELFKKLIGEHFKFTGYGMEWIRKCWEQDIYPSYIDFAKFWKDETERRKSGSSFKSLGTNRRVVFFRENKGLDKDKLEKLWIKERNKNFKIVRELLKIK